MKFLKYISIILVIALASADCFAQSGELNRFRNESLSVTNEIKLFPNPSVDFLEVKIDNSTLENVSFTVHNIIGNIVNVEVEKVSDDKFRLRVEDLSPGYYLLAIKDEQNVFKETYKFLKR
ncbi:MAG: T9SS type A sorting domain-containing protein [Fulvivirga sp.]|uniref:T9SS type A sorting domain-containing protein n=1 Tax=Fulvivirga sp. TaxID=1931237 RepID=UPI0032EB66F9